MKGKGRIAIFAFYDPDGIADRYIEYLLADLCRNLQRLVIVCNGMVQPQTRQRLSVYTDQILERRNEGYDIWGYKAGIDMLGWKEICQYEELLLCNDSIMGPVYPLRGMFEVMDSRKADFWGITKHYAIQGNPFDEQADTDLPEHIQSYFMVFRNNILCDSRFQEYWAKLPMLHSYAEAVNCHESTFTARLTEMGYLYDVYVDTEEYKDYTPNPVMMCPDILVDRKKCPVIKRRIFTTDYKVRLHDTTGGAPGRLMQYLEQHTDYDTDMIWENILRIGRLDQIAYNLQLHYILNENNVSKSKVVPHMGVVLPTCRSEHLLMQLPEGVNICEVSMEQLFSAEGEQTISQYDLLCLLPELTADTETPGSAVMDLQYSRWQNLIGNSAYLRQIANCFQEHPRLGALYPPIACHGSYIKNASARQMGGWFRRTALQDMLRTDNGDGRGTHHSFYAAVIYNQAELRQQLNNEAYQIEQCLVQELAKYRAAHDHAVTEWKRTAEQLKAYQEAHDRVVAEWQKTDEQLKAYQEAHDRVVAEWTQTAETLQQLQAEYDTLKKSRIYKLANIFKCGSK